MLLTEQTTVPAAALPVAAFRDHMRLGTGFAEDGAEDPMLEAVLRAAIAAVEGRTGKVLLTRGFVWRLHGWSGAERQPLPVAPVATVSELRIVDRLGVVAVVAPEAWRLERDTHRPRLVSLVSGFPQIPLGGEAEVVFEAGFGADWAAVPSDLAQAVFLLAAEYYDSRSAAMFEAGAMPFGVLALLERWRTVRVLGGGAT